MTRNQQYRIQIYIQYYHHYHHNNNNYYYYYIKHVLAQDIADRLFYILSNNQNERKSIFLYLIRPYPIHNIYIFSSSFSFFASSITMSFVTIHLNSNCSNVFVICLTFTPSNKRISCLLNIECLLRIRSPLCYYIQEIKNILHCCVSQFLNRSLEISSFFTYLEADYFTQWCQSSKKAFMKML